MRATAWRFETPQQVQFVEKLSDVVIGQLPNFWKLWISYVNGSLFSEVRPKRLNSCEEIHARLNLESNG